jgi:hypothetical protein
MSGSYAEPLLCHYSVHNTTLCNMHINTPLLLYNKHHPFLPLPLDHPPPSVAITIGHQDEWAFDSSCNDQTGLGMVCMLLIWFIVEKDNEGRNKQR